MPAPQYRMHASGIDDLGVVHTFAGGFDGTTHYIYNANADAWSVSIPMPTGVTDPGVVTVGHQLYVMGGPVPGGPGRTQIFDADGVGWSAGPNLLPATTNNTSAALAATGAIFVEGGFNGTASILVNWSLQVF